MCHRSKYWKIRFHTKTSKNSKSDGILQPLLRQHWHHFIAQCSRWYNSILRFAPWATCGSLLHHGQERSHFYKAWKQEITYIPRTYLKYQFLNMTKSIHTISPQTRWSPTKHIHFIRFKWILILALINLSVLIPKIQTSPSIWRHTDSVWWGTWDHVAPWRHFLYFPG